MGCPGFSTGGWFCLRVRDFGIRPVGGFGVKIVGDSLVGGFGVSLVGGFGVRLLGGSLVGGFGVKVIGGGPEPVPLGTF